MRFYDFISSIKDSLKRSTIDRTSVKNIYQSSYHYSCATVSKIDHTIRVNAVDKLNQHLPDQKTLYQFAISLAKNTVHEGVKCVPGGMILYRIVSKSIGDANKCEDPKKEVRDRKKADKIVQEGLKDQPPSPSLKNKKKQEDLMQQNMVSAKNVEGSEPLKKIANGKKVLIRSLL